MPPKINQSKIQIPNSIIRNKNINHNAFCLFVLLKYYTYKYGTKNKVILDHQVLRKKLGLKSNKPFKDAITSLKQSDIITNNIDTLPPKGKITFELNTDILNNKKPFTQLPSSIRFKISTIGTKGCRLLYYYESYINRTENQQFCYCSFRTIQEHLGMSPNTITKFNQLLKKQKLLKIERFKLEPTYAYDNDDCLIIDKYNNHYYPLINNI